MMIDTSAPPERIYRARPHLRYGLPLLALTGLAGVILLAAAWGRAESRGGWLLAAAAVCGLAAIILAGLTGATIGVRLEIYPGWFRYRSPKVQIEARWDQIDCFYTCTTQLARRRWRPVGRHEYRIEVFGRRIEFGTAVGATAALGRLIDERTRPRIVARAKAHLQSGRSVPFGPVTVHRDGLSFKGSGRRHISYVELERHGLEHGRYVFKAYGKRMWASIPITQIPNPLALAQLIDEITSWRDQSPAVQETTDPATV
jgi:hypothetical protein